eukprot:m.147690 g.147690  ORF g.147690 m.147690 type:complete len:442 (+) comp11663_c0_seq2:607-1932(+)
MQAGIYTSLSRKKILEPPESDVALRALMWGGDNQGYRGKVPGGMERLTHKVLKNVLGRDTLHGSASPRRNFLVAAADESRVRIEMTMNPKFRAQIASILAELVTEYGGESVTERKRGDFGHVWQVLHDTGWSTTGRFTLPLCVAAAQSVYQRCGGSASLSFTHPITHWLMKMGVAAATAIHPNELFNRNPPGGEGDQRDWTLGDSRFNYDVPMPSLTEEWKSIPALILDHVSSGRCREAFVDAIPPTGSLLVTSGCRDGDLTLLAAANSDLYRFTHNSDKYGQGKDATETPAQSAHADVSYVHDDIVSHWLPGGQTLSLIWSTDPTCPRRVDLLVDQDGKLVQSGDLKQEPEGFRWKTIELLCGEFIVFYAQGVHGGGCNHMNDGTPPTGSDWWPWLLAWTPDKGGNRCCTGCMDNGGMSRDRDMARGTLCAQQVSHMRCT